MQLKVIFQIYIMSSVFRRKTDYTLSPINDRSPINTPIYLPNTQSIVKKNKNSVIV